MRISKRSKYFILACILALQTLLSGCSSEMKALRDDNKFRGIDALVNDAESFAQAPSIVKLKMPKGAFELEELKSSTDSRKITVDFPGVTVETAASVIAKHLNTNILVDPELQGISKNVRIQYSGEVSELLRVLSKHTGYFFVQDGSTLLVKRRHTFSVLLPSYLTSGSNISGATSVSSSTASTSSSSAPMPGSFPAMGGGIPTLDAASPSAGSSSSGTGLLSEIRENLLRLGASDLAYDSLSSRLTFKCDASTYTQVAQFLKQVKDNASLITLRVIIIGVRLDGARSAGIDWTKLNLGYGSQMQTSGFGNAEDSTDSTTETTDTTSTTTAAATNLLSKGLGIIGTSTGAGVFIQAKNFTLSTLLNFIESYGSSDLKQNVFVQTMSGREGHIEVLTETPYVSQVAVAALSSTATATQSSASTATAKTGVELKVSPYYYREGQTLAIKLGVGVYGVNRMIELSAGTLGSFIQPETTKRTIDTIIRMNPDQVVVLGGLIHEYSSGQASGLPADSYLTKSMTKNRVKEELVIALKPTIYEFVSE